ncbi:hypothetical protein [Tardiphaga sp. P5_C10]
MAKWIVLALAALALTGCSERQAVEACKAAIKEKATNPSAAVIPSPGDVASGKEIVFINWKRGDGLRLQNNFGALLDVSATCTYSKATKQVDYLSLGNDVVIGSLPK